MKKKSKIILGVCIVAAALIGMSVWNTWFSPTKIAFINFQTIQQGSISKANDNSSIKLSEVSLDNLDRPRCAGNRGRLFYSQPLRRLKVRYPSRISVAAIRINGMVTS